MTTARNTLGIAIALCTAIGFSANARAEKKQPAEKASKKNATVRLHSANGISALGQHTVRANSFDLRGRRGRTALAPKYEEVMRFDKQRLNQRQITSVVRANSRQIRNCYSAAAARAKAPTGEVTVGFVVEPKGHVSSVTVEAGGVNARRLERCMKRRIRRWKFPAADAETTVEYPFVFDVAGSTLGSK